MTVNLSVLAINLMNIQSNPTMKKIEDAK